LGKRKIKKGILFDTKTTNKRKEKVRGRSDFCYLQGKKKRSSYLDQKEKGQNGRIDGAGKKRGGGGEKKKKDWGMFLQKWGADRVWEGGGGGGRRGESEAKTFCAEKGKGEGGGGDPGPTARVSDRGLARIGREEGGDGKRHPSCGRGRRGKGGK